MSPHPQPGHICQCLEIFLVITHGGGDSAASIQGIEGRDTAKHTAVHGTDPATENYPAQNVNGTKVGKPRCKLMSYTQTISGKIHKETVILSVDRNRVMGQIENRTYCHPMSF